MYEYIFWETEEGLKPPSLQMVPKWKDLPTPSGQKPWDGLNHNFLRVTEENASFTK